MMNEEFIKAVEKAGRDPRPEDIIHFNNQSSWRHRGDILTRLDCPDCKQLIMNKLWPIIESHVKQTVVRAVEEHERNYNG